MTFFSTAVWQRDRYEKNVLERSTNYAGFNAIVSANFEFFFKSLSNLCWQPDEKYSESNPLVTQEAKFAGSFDKSLKERILNVP